MQQSSSKYFWYFLLALVLLFYFAQATAYLDEWGIADALSISLFSVALFVAAGILGKGFSVAVLTIVTVLNVAILIGCKFYFDLYQSYVPFSILSFAADAGPLIDSFSILFPVIGILMVVGIAMLFWHVVSRLSFPKRLQLATAFILILGASLTLQVYHDSRASKQFQIFSEVPLGYFLRSGGLVPFIDGNPLAERMNNIQVLASSINDGFSREVPKAYLDAIASLFPERSGTDNLYPMQFVHAATSENANTPGKPGSKEHKNVIVFVLESFRASEMGAYGSKQSATPFLDSLSERSLLARKFYSAAPFTVKSETAINCGVFDYFGRESESASKRDGQLKATCTPVVLSERGYDTYWFHGNTKDFYNRSSYLPSIGFNHILGSEELYGEEFFKQKSLNRRRGTQDKPLLGWGIPDPVLFPMALQQLELADKPFYAEILSVSNHLPFDWDWGIDFPAGLRATDTFHEKYRRGMYYTDLALKDFFEKFQESDLSDNTIIVITGDHGVWTFDKQQVLTELNKHEQFFRMPLLVYEKGIQPKVITQPASHVDIPPTILSLLGVKAETVFFGRSLVDEPEKSVPIYSLFEASYSFRLADKICLPGNRCFRNGPECTGFEAAAMKKSEMICYVDVGEMMFDNRLVPSSVPEQTKTHIDNFLNYAMLGLQIGFVPERGQQVENQEHQMPSNADIVKTHQ